MLTRKHFENRPHEMFSLADKVLSLNSLGVVRYYYDIPNKKLRVIGERGTLHLMLSGETSTLNSNWRTIYIRTKSRE